MPRGWPRQILLVCIAMLGLNAALASSASGEVRTEVVTVNVRPGVTMKYLELVPSSEPEGAVILLAGGNGLLSLRADGTIETDLALNFLVRSRELFAREGLLVAVLDAASDRPQGMNGDIRLSAQHAQDLGRVIDTVKSRAKAPVWLVGTSAGTISAASAAARLAGSQQRPHGLVLTAVLTTLAPGLCGRSVYFASLSAIRGPVLVASHRDDGCACSPGDAAVGAKLLATLKRASGKEHKIFTGGDPPVSKSPCHARTPHGFFGIEDQVVKAIADWIKAH